MRRTTPTFLLIGCSFMLLACNGPNSNYAEFGDRANTRGFGHKFAQPENSDELVVGPGDAIGIEIANNADLSSQQPVSIEGNVLVPFVGLVKVAGLSPTQIRDKVTILLTPYITEVAVQIVPLTFQSKRIYIYATGQYGELAGRIFPLQGDLTLIDLFTMIGGATPLGDDCHVVVVRGDPRHPKRLDINVRDMIVNGYTAGNIQLRPDDIVWLQPSLFAKIAQTLNKATLPLRVLSQTLRQAGQAYYFVDGGYIGGGGGGYGGGAGSGF